MRSPSDELRRCGIPANGCLGPFRFRFQNYYWVVEGGRVPLDVAQRLYADPVGRTDIRAGGHCGCPSPDEYGTAYFAADGREMMCRRLDDPKGQAKDEALLDKYNPGWRSTHIYVDDPRAECVSASVDLYHIDSELGLYVFVRFIREAGLLTSEAEHV